MSFNAWKYLTYLRDAISKLTTSDRSLMQNDLLQLLNKIPQPPDFSEYLKTAEKKFSSVHQSVQNIYNTSVTSGAKMLPTNKGKSKEEAPWKKVKRLSQSEHYLSEISTTARKLETIRSASTEEDLLIGVESFLCHVRQHPEVRNNAIKHGATRILLQKRRQTTNQKIRGALREALAILGYTDPVSGQGIRILAIDGGGIRGVLVLEMLKKLEELTGKRTYELFDFFCGVSTGAILTYSMGIHLRSLDDIIARYEALSQEIFKRSPLLGTGKLVWNHAYYDTALWERKLREYLGDDPLITTSRNGLCPKICVVSAVVNQSELSAYVFRNYSLPWKFKSEYEGSFETPIWQAARASAAAPTYFEEFRIGDLIHQDGGILVNNPTSIAIHEAKLLWPNTPIQCVVSFGTGRSVPSPAELSNEKKRRLVTDTGNEGTSWTNKFLKILDSATDTQTIHIMLSDLLPDNVYYRFNPYLTEMIGLVETDTEKQKQMKRDTLMYLRRNEDKFQQAARTLMLDKTRLQRAKDNLNLQRELLGI